MSRPNMEGKTISDAMWEISSTISSLYCYPEPREGMSYTENEYLADIDTMAGHAVDHARQAMQILLPLQTLSTDLSYALSFIPNKTIPDMSKHFLRRCCKTLGINLGVIGDINPADPESFEYIDTDDFSIDNAWNLWLFEIWSEARRYELAHFMSEWEDYDV